MLTCNIYFLKGQLMIKIILIVAAVALFLPTICMEDRKRKSEQIEELKEEVTSKKSHQNANIVIIHVCIAKNDMRDLCLREFSTLESFRYHLQITHSISLNEQNKKLYSYEMAVDSYDV
jgi:hypothetical protein